MIFLPGNRHGEGHFLFENTEGSVEGRCLSFKLPTSKIYEQLRLIGQNHHV